MLILTLPEREMYDERQNLFYTLPKVTLQLEHSLIAISKWESKWKKPFINPKPKQVEEFRDYVRCMTINKVDPDVYVRLTQADFRLIQAYIDDPMTATTILDLKKDKGKSKVVTSELIYYWMDAAQIPWEAEKWHFNRLMTLIRVHSVESNSNNKMPKAEAAKYQHSMNMARRAKHAKKH